MGNCSQTKIEHAFYAISKLSTLFEKYSRGLAERGQEEEEENEQH